ncbi:MAG TPA: PspC domain-containing protein [Mycobacteriales bacterium]|nr:PspC domain-containing protein [Mycobacteriales bacterium]
MHEHWRGGGRNRSRLHRRRRNARGHGPPRRASDDRLVGGVAAGLARTTGFDVTLIRVVFVVAALTGYGLAAYVVAWLVLPAADTNANIATKALTDRRGITLAVGVASLLALVLVIISAIGAGWVGPIAWPSVVSAAGLVLIWRNAPADERATMRSLVDALLGSTGTSRLARTRVRISIAIILLISGLGILLAGHASLALLTPLGGLVLVMAAIIVALGPWWLRIARDLAVERQARIRAEERSEMAARVHDSVLQTLALIQLRADQPQQVTQLARAQERELRSWLFDGHAPGSIGAETVSLAAGVRLIQREVEAQHEVSIDAVTVGDCELDDDLGALLAAAREATVNAVKWSGAQVVSVFAEVEPTMVSVFVRDRGRGFDPGSVPADRKGLAESVHGRMERRGGAAVIRSAPGDGTEVSLTMPRASRPRQPSRS